MTPLLKVKPFPAIVLFTCNSSDVINKPLFVAKLILKVEPSNTNPVPARYVPAPEN